MDGRSEGRTVKPKAIWLFNFSKVGGIKTSQQKRMLYGLKISIQIKQKKMKGQGSSHLNM